MTNEQIIFNARCELMEQGVIGTTGRTLQVETEDGTTRYMPEPDEIHTYTFWRENYGMVPQKGTHAIANLRIWKRGKRKKENPEDEDQERMFLTKGFFFSPDQLEPVTDREQT